MDTPVRGSGDGGIYTTVADGYALWGALDDGRVVSREWYAEMTRPRSDVPSESARYGLGFWLHESGDGVAFEGMDAGVSCRSVRDAAMGLTHTVLANTSSSAWPVGAGVHRVVAGAPPPRRSMVHLLPLDAGPAGRLARGRSARAPGARLARRLA